MKKEVQELFDGLNKLCSTNEAFYFSEQEYEENYIIRSFTYRLASWTDFQEPFAKDSRGTAFVLDKRTGEWDLFCRAYKKFHNLGEGVPKEDFMKDNEPIVSYEKLDGSLILVGSIQGKLIAKSKTSINSEQAVSAQKMLEENEGFRACCEDMISNNYTPVFEIIGPSNVIVLRYATDTVVHLGSVDNITGEVFTVQDEYGEDLFYSNYGIRCARPYQLSWAELLHIQETSKPVIEGYVTETKKGLVKIKVSSYVDLHHLKDSIHNMKHLVKTVLDDSVDDLIGSFQDDQDTIDYIVGIQNKVSHKFNHLVVEFKELRRKYFNDFEENRKEFAIKHSKDVLFSYVMKTLNTSFRDVEQTAEAQVKMFIEKQCNTSSSAENWVEGNNSENR